MVTKNVVAWSGILKGVFLYMYISCLEKPDTSMYICADL